MTIPRWITRILLRRRLHRMMPRRHNREFRKTLIMRRRMKLVRFSKLTAACQIKRAIPT